MSRTYIIIYLCACKYTHLQSQRHPQTRNNNWGFLDRPSPNTPKLIRQIDLSQPSRPTYRCCIHLYPISHWIPINCLLLYSIAWFLKTCPHIMSSWLRSPWLVLLARSDLWAFDQDSLVLPFLAYVSYITNPAKKKNTISNCKNPTNPGQTMPNHTKQKHIQVTKAC